MSGVEIALDFLTGFAPGLVPRGRLANLLLAPTDSVREWGDGLEMRGRACHIMMAVSGRRASLPFLTGPGVDLLASRLRA